MVLYSDNALETHGPSTAEQVVDDLATRWADANRRSDRRALVDLYHPDALFYGSHSELKLGAKGIRAYFDGVPDGSVRDVRFGEFAVSQAAENVVVAAAFVDFDLLVEDVLERWRWRIMWTLTRRADGRWLISGHHAAPRER